MVFSQKQKGLSSIFGGVVFNIGIGSIFPMATFNVYIISYINHFRQYDPYPLSYGYFIIPIITFVMALFGPVGGLIDYKLGCHMNLIIGSLVCVSGAMTLYCVTQLWLMYAGICLYGIGSGLAMMASMKNACFYFPSKKGMISAAMAACISVGGAMYNYFGESMINPTNYQLKEGELFYDFSIAQNTLKYYLFQAIALSVCTCIAMLLIFRYKPIVIETNIPKNDQSLIHNMTTTTIITNNNNEAATESLIQPLPQSQPQSQPQNESITVSNLNQTQTSLPNRKNTYYKSDIKQVLQNRRIWILFITNFLSSFLLFSIRSTFKVIGTTRHFSISSLKVASVGGAIGMSLFSPLWGFLYDMFGFKYLIIILNVCGVVLGVLICFSMNSEVFFVSLILFSTILIAGVMSVFPPHTMKIFSIKYATELGGIMAFSIGLSNVFGSVWAFIVSIYFAGESYVFYISYLIGAAFSLISVFLAFLETGIEYDYGHIDNTVSIPKDNSSIENKGIIEEKKE